MVKSKKDLKLFSQSGKPLDIVGRWGNELQSVMTIDTIKDGIFSGTYLSKVSEKETPVAGTLTGTLARDTIAFVVNWEPTFASVTSWAGKLLATETGDAQIYTLWHLSQGVDDSQDWWQSFLAGSDTFWRLS